MIILSKKCSIIYIFKINNFLNLTQPQRIKFLKREK